MIVKYIWNHFFQQSWTYKSIQIKTMKHTTKRVTFVFWIVCQSKFLNAHKIMVAHMFWIHAKNISVTIDDLKYNKTYTKTYGIACVATISSSVGPKVRYDNLKSSWNNVLKLNHTFTNVGECKRISPNTLKWILTLGIGSSKLSHNFGTRQSE